MAGDFTFGIEEEYFLVDADDQIVCARACPSGVLRGGRARRPAAGSPANSCSRKSKSSRRRITSMAEARTELRATAADLGRGRRRARPRLSGRRHAPDRRMARGRSRRPKERYDAVMDDSADDRAAQHAVRHACACRAVRIPIARVDLMYRMLPYLPLFLALSTSSPFWQSRRTGLKGYRLAAYDELPRTGVPRAVPHQGGVRRLCRRAGACRRDGGLKLCLVGDPPLAQASRRWSCARPTAARCSTTRWRSRRSTARWRGISINNPWRNADMKPSPAPSWSRTSGGRSATACTAPSSPRKAP